MGDSIKATGESFRKSAFAAGLTCLVLLTTFLFGYSYGEQIPGAESAQSGVVRSKSVEDSLRVIRLFTLAVRYADQMDEPVKADSISDLAVSIAEEGRRDHLIWMAFHRYIRTNDLDLNYKKALGFAMKAEQLVQGSHMHNQLFDTYIDFSLVYRAGYQFDQALDYAYRALSVATNNTNNRQMAESYLQIGRCLEGKNRMIDAFRNYISANILAEKLNDKALLDICYAEFSKFYSLSKLHSKAVQYNLKRQALALQKKPVDSTGYMWLLYDLQVIDMNSGVARLDAAMVEKVLSYAKRHNHRRLNNYQIALYRSQMIEMNDIGRLHDFYYLQYPQEWRSLYAENPGLFFRLKALFCEADHKVDSADIYFKKAATVLDSDPNLILKSKFYHRYGEFYLRHGQKEKALDMFTKSFDLAEKASYFKYMMLASGELEALYVSVRDFERAYDFASRNRILADSLNNLSKKDQILVMEIDHETREQEIMADKLRHETERRHYLQYMAMVIAILTTFVILIMLGSLRVSEWIIRMLGFFSFIFLFEFIILLADHKIHELTHGEPWKIMLIKIFLIAILLPLHHSVEKRVITYLLSHQLIKKSHFSFLQGLKLRRKKKPTTAQPD